MPLKSLLSHAPLIFAETAVEGRGCIRILPQCRRYLQTESWTSCRSVMLQCRCIRPLRIRCVAAVVLLSAAYFMYVYRPAHSIEDDVGRQNWAAAWWITTLNYNSATQDFNSANLSSAAITVESDITGLVSRDDENTTYGVHPQGFRRIPRNSTFSFSEDFSFPHPSAFKSIHSIQSASWVKALQEFLISISPGRTVTLTVASKDYTQNVLNWLISAQVIAEPSLQNVLVVSFDKSLHNLLTQRQISSIFVPHEAVLKSSKGLSRVWMTRMAVIRLINHWGFDVQQFDTDAVILRNPEPLYQQFPDSDVVGSRGMLPFDIGKKLWGFTVCMGAVLFRSTPKTGKWSYLIHLCMSYQWH